MKTSFIFILGILVGIGISFWRYDDQQGKKYTVLNQDYKLENGGILKKGTKIKYNTSFSEGFEQYSLCLNMPIGNDNETIVEKENVVIIPYGMEPILENKEMERKIVGEWGIYVSFFEGTIANCNACPKIKFKDNNTAILTLPNNDEEYYSWNLNNSALSIHPLNKEETRTYFNNSEYEIEINNKGDFIELMMFESKENGYILRR